MWFVGVVRWRSIVSNLPQYSNSTLLRLIDSWCDWYGMFSGETLCTVHSNISIEFWWNWLICNVICRRCSKMKYSLLIVSIIQQNYFSNDWFVVWFLKNMSNDKRLFVNRLNIWTDVFWVQLIFHVICRKYSMMKDCI